MVGDDIFSLVQYTQCDIRVRYQHKLRWQTFYIKQKKNISSLWKFYGMQNQLTSFIAISTTKATNEHQLKKKALLTSAILHVICTKMRNSFFCVLYFLLKSVNHIKMPCGKQIVWIEFTRVYTLIPPYSTHRPMVKCHQRQKYSDIFRKYFLRNELKWKIIQFKFNAINLKKMLQFKQ